MFKSFLSMLISINLILLSTANAEVGFDQRIAIVNSSLDWRAMTGILSTALSKEDISFIKKLMAESKIAMKDKFIVKIEGKKIQVPGLRKTLAVQNDKMNYDGYFLRYDANKSFEQNYKTISGLITNHHAIIFPIDILSSDT